MTFIIQKTNIFWASAKQQNQKNVPRNALMIKDYE